MQKFWKMVVCNKITQVHDSAFAKHLSLGNKSIYPHRKKRETWASMPIVIYSAKIFLAHLSNHILLSSKKKNTNININIDKSQNKPKVISKSQTQSMYSIWIM